MKNVSIDRGTGRKSRRGKKLFDDDGSLVDAEINILNFKPGPRADEQGQWDEVRELMQNYYST